MNLTNKNLVLILPTTHSQIDQRGNNWFYTDHVLIPITIQNRKKVEMLKKNAVATNLGNSS